MYDTTIYRIAIAISIVVLITAALFFGMFIYEWSGRRKLPSGLWSCVGIIFFSGMLLVGLHG